MGDTNTSNTFGSVVTKEVVTSKSGNIVITTITIKGR